MLETTNSSSTPPAWPVVLRNRRDPPSKVTTARRRLGITRAFGRLFAYTMDGGGVVGEGDDGGDDEGPDRTTFAFPMPKLAAGQFYTTLCSIGVEVVQ